MGTLSPRIDVTTSQYPTGHGPGRVLVAGPETGPPIVLVHGYASSADQWRPLLAWLTDRYRVYAPDLLGFADAPKPPPPYVTERWVSQIARLLDAVNAPRAVLIGHSLGGLVVMNVAATHPERVSGLVLIASMGLPSPNAEALLRGPRGVLIRLVRLPGLGELVFWSIRGRRQLAEKIALGAYHDPSRAPADSVATWLDLIYRPRAHRAYVDIVRRLERLTTSLEIGDLTQPTLIVWGADDRGMPVTMAEDYRRLIPQAEVAIIAASGHIPHSEHPAATAAALLPFLDQLAATESNDVASSPSPQRPGNS